MAKNDVLLIDGIIEDRIAKSIPSKQIDEVFEYLAFEQILKHYDLDEDEIVLGSVDGRNDGGIDAIYIFINGHLLKNPESFKWPRSNVDIQVYFITCKHHSTFQLQPVDSIYASLAELLDFSKDCSEFCAEYNEMVIERREAFLHAYRMIAPYITQLDFHVIYASRGDTSIIGQNIVSRGNQVRRLICEYFSNCTSEFSFWGSSEILVEYRKIPDYSLSIVFDEILTHENSYVLLTPLNNYFEFISEENKLRRYLFESNVRDFLGDNRVNVDIMETLKNPNENSDFWLLNNGITILSSSANIIGKSIRMENIQIVNGLQTTETIYKYFKMGNHDVGRSILIKVIVTEDANLRDNIIRATNNQTQVSLSSLSATDKIQRDIEDILKRNDIFYERRTNYYVNQGVPKEMIIKPLFLASAYVSLVLKTPYVAGRLKNKFLTDPNQYEMVFSEETDLRIWPQLVKLYHLVDSTIENDGENIKKNYVKCLRHIIAFLTTSIYFKRFNFTTGDLIELNICEIKCEEILETKRFIERIEPFDYENLKKWSSRKVLVSICSEAANHYNINDLNSIIYRKDFFPNISSLSYRDIQIIRPEFPLNLINQENVMAISKKLNIPGYKVWQALNYYNVYGDKLFEIYNS